MINLLPPELKENYSYARKNVGLRRWIVTFAMRSRGRVALKGAARNSKSGDAGEARTLTVEGSRLRRVGWADEREVKRKTPSRRSTKTLLDRASSRLCLVLIGGQLPID